MVMVSISLIALFALVVLILSMKRASVVQNEFETKRKEFENFKEKHLALTQSANKYFNSLGNDGAKLLNELSHLIALEEQILNQIQQRAESRDLDDLSVAEQLLDQSKSETKAFKHSNLHRINKIMDILSNKIVHASEKKEEFSPSPRRQRRPTILNLVKSGLWKGKDQDNLR